MGHGIAQTFALAGCDVACFDDSPGMRDSLPGRVRTNLTAFAEAGLIEPWQIDPTLARLRVAGTEGEAVAEAQFVTEAVSEDLEIKQALFSRLDRIARPEAILASNSSSFPISQSGNRMQHPERALVTHWFNPPHLTPVVEVVPSPRTSAGTVQTTLDLLQRLGKYPVPLQRELPGFLVNRVQVAIQREVWDLVGQGVATPEEIDAAIRGTIGFRFAALGPLEIHDFGGLDIQLATFRNLVPEIRSDTAPPPIIQDLTAKGWLGTKTGRGFYNYPPDRLEARRARRDSSLLKLKKLLYSVDSPDKLPDG
jgi:3-hydroxyacyl-CoA dehydrogenase